jgi:hypothetical protein
LTSRTPRRSALRFGAVPLRLRTDSGGTAPLREGRDRGRDVRGQSNAGNRSCGSAGRLPVASDGARERKRSPKDLEGEQAHGRSERSHAGNGGAATTDSPVEESLGASRASGDGRGAAAAVMRYGFWRGEPFEGCPRRGHNATNPTAASGAQQTRRPAAEQAVEVVRDHEDGTRHRGLETPIRRKVERSTDREWTRQETRGGGATAGKARRGGIGRTSDTPSGAGEGRCDKVPAESRAL